jgi:cytochrome d ubiquinol oxidase subunit I
VLASLLMYVAVYLLIYPVGVSLMLRMVWRGPVSSDAPAPIGGGRPNAPIEALASPASGTPS